MKRKAIIFFAIVFIGFNSANAQLFPRVDRPTSDDMSLLAVLFGHENDGEYETLSNTNFSGWAPAVKGPNGEYVKFRNFDTGSGITNIYYAENLPAGEYTLTGFFHVYTNYSKLEEYKKQINNSSYMVNYAPYENRPYHVKQHIPLSEPVIVNLQPNSMQSLGTFAVKYQWFEGLAGTSDDRWRVIDETAISMEKPLDDHVLGFMKPWRTRSWRPWNEKNQAAPL